MTYTYIKITMLGLALLVVVAVIIDMLRNNDGGIVGLILYLGVIVALIRIVTHIKDLLAQCRRRR